MPRVQPEAAGPRPASRRFTPPNLGPVHVARPRLSAALAALRADAELLVVTAPAGAGKSTAIAELLAPEPRVAWLNLDADDADVSRLVAHLCSALRPLAGPHAGPRRRPPGERSPVDRIEDLATSGALTGTVLVLDGTEHLQRSVESWGVVAALLRFGTPALALILLSRQPLPPDLCAVPGATNMATLSPHSLDFDVGETEILVRDLGIATDPREVHAQTGGWVAGTRLIATGQPERIDYLLEGALAALPQRLREFLVSAAILPEVSVRWARAVGIADAGLLMAELTRWQIPGAGGTEAGNLRYSPLLRQHLRERFDRLPESESRPLRVRLGRELLRKGCTEAGVSELLRAGLAHEIRAAAEGALITLLDNGDLPTAEHWLDELHAAGVSSDGTVTAELMLAIAQDDYRRATAVLAELEASGERDRLARSSDRAAAMMAWCYLHQGRPRDLADIARQTPSSPLRYAIVYATAMISDPAPGSSPPSPPPLNGEPSDALILITDYTIGRSDFSHADQVSAWVRIVSQPGRIAALRAAGRLAEALREHDEAVVNGTANLAYRVYMGPELLIDAGLAESAQAAVEEGRRLAEATGSVGYRALNAVAAAKYQLRLAGDPEAARRVMDEAERSIRGREFRLISGVLDTWYGLALLLQGVNLAAAQRLRRATAGMVAGHRMLELPIAAIYLSEAEWRLGDEAAADAAAELALRASEITGSNSQLVRALRDFPDVVSRRIDASRATDTPWHALGRALLFPDNPVARRTGARAAHVHVADFERSSLEIDSAPVHPRLHKSCELLAFLALRPGGAAPRDEVMAALFEQRTGASSAGYLRQACHQVRQVLPDPALLRADDGWIAIADSVAFTADSLRFETLLSDARRVAGAERVDMLAEAFALCRGREYLPGTDSSWAVRRRQELLDQLTTARLDAAELCFRLGRLDDAAEHAHILIEQDAYHEEGWRLQMRVAGALGSSAGVLRAFRRCAAALAELGTSPTAGTRALLEQLRR